MKISTSLSRMKANGKQCNSNLPVKMKNYYATGDSKYTVSIDLCNRVNKNRISDKYYVLFDNKMCYLFRNCIKYKIQVNNINSKFEASIYLSD